jgi:hypothetical protein
MRKLSKNVTKIVKSTSPTLGIKGMKMLDFTTKNDGMKLGIL